MADLPGAPALTVRAPAELPTASDLELMRDHAAAASANSSIGSLRMAPARRRLPSRAPTLSSPDTFIGS